MDFKTQYHADSVFLCNVKIGEGTTISGPLVCTGGGNVIIGNHCAFGWGIKMHTVNHRLDRIIMHDGLSREVGAGAAVCSKGDIRIGHGVWIGSNVVLLSGVTIGNGSAVGAGAIVTRDVMPYSVVVGNPARMIRMRFDQATIDRIELSRWWEWDFETMCSRLDFFTGEERF
jgi:virginiamycin A acetyltransferase